MSRSGVNVADSDPVTVFASRSSVAPTMYFVRSLRGATRVSCDASHPFGAPTNAVVVVGATVVVVVDGRVVGAGSLSPLEQAAVSAASAPTIATTRRLTAS